MNDIIAFMVTAIKSRSQAQYILVISSYSLDAPIHASSSLVFALTELAKSNASSRMVSIAFVIII